MTTSTPVVHVITELGDGGAEAALYRLCTAPGNESHHVISLMDEGKYGPLLRAAGISVTCIGMQRNRLSPAALWRLWRGLRKLRPRAVQTWMYHADLLGGVAARLAGIRNVAWGIHNSVLVPGQNSAGTILIARICARLSHVVPRAIICCAHKAARVHVALGYRAAAMHVVPNGYDLTLFRPDPEQRSTVRAELGLGDEDVVGFVARHDPAKDHANLLRALAILKARGACPLCLLAGGGMKASNAALSAEIARHDVGDRVVLLGRRSDVPAIMNALDVHILSSAAEAFPNVLAEAMACGTPCVSTDVGDAVDIVGDSGWIVPPGNPDALADAVEAALTARHSADWSARREHARQWIARSFSIAQMNRGYRRVWNDDHLKRGSDEH